MVDEEKVDKEYTEQETRENPAKISANKTSNPAEISADSVNKTSEQKPFVCDECDKGFDTQKALSGHMTSHSKKKAEAKKKKEEETTSPSGEVAQEEKKPLTPYEEVEPADVFLRKFLSEFDFKENFVDLLCRRVKRRNAMPHPNDLANDIQDMPSGITNPKSANYIAEEYSYELKDYEKRLKSTNKLRSSMGYDVDLTGSHNTDHGGLHHGISLDGQVRDFRHDEENQRVEKTPVDPVKETLKKYRARKAERILDLMSTKELTDIERELSGGKEGEEEKKHTLVVDGVSLKLTTEEMLSWKRYLAEEKRVEEEREERKAERKQAIEHQSQNDGGLVEWVVGEGSDARIIKVRPETLPSLIQAQGSRNPSQDQSGPSRDEVAQMVERSLEAKTKHMTTDDVESIVQRAMGGYQQGALTKHDLLYLEAKDKLHLEEKKLDESGKTRDVIGNAIRDGFGHAGRIISRMMTEEGGATGMPVEGYSDQAGNMMQMACPRDLGGCGTVITAPIGSPMVVCPGCGKRWSVEPPGYEQTPPKQKIESTTPAQKTELTTDAPKIISEPTTDASDVTPEPVTVPSDVAYEPTTIDVPEDISEPAADVEKIAENIAIGEAADFLEEELKKKKTTEELRQRHEEENERKRKSALKKVEDPIKESPEKKPVRSKRCPVCKKPFKNRRAVASHITQKHPEYHKK